MFNVSAHACIALLLVAVARHLAHLVPGRIWYVAWTGSFVVLSLHAYFAWNETMGLVKFYSKLPKTLLKYPK